MGQFSSHYRNDDAAGLPAEVGEYLDKHYLDSQPSLTVSNPRVLVVFSGGNSVGKSTLAKAICGELKGLVLENDEMKKYITQLLPDIDHAERNRITWQYSMGLYERLGDLTPNGLVVRDGIIDWYYDRILPIFERQGYRLFIVGYDVSDDKQRELILQRGDKPTINTDRLLHLIGEHKAYIAKFRNHYTPNVLLNDGNMFDHNVVIERLRQFARAKA